MEITDPVATAAPPLPHRLLLPEEEARLAFSRVQLDAGTGCEPAVQVLTHLAAAADTAGGGAVLRIVVGQGAGSRARALAQGQPGGARPAEGYQLQVRPEPGGVLAVIDAADPPAACRGVQTLAALIGPGPDGCASVPITTVVDQPALIWRGTIEGFYGPPWSHRQRLAHLEFSARVNLNRYVYAPKDDPYHRDRWRERYPHAELQRLVELADSARQHGVDFIYALSPGLTMRMSDDGEHAALAAKAAQLLDAGIGHFSLFFDDIPPELTDPADRARYGIQPGSAGAGHGEVCARFQSEFLNAHGVHEPMLMCPVDYAGTQDSPYRQQLATTLPTDALVAWTGEDIVVATVTRQHIDQAAASFQRQLVLWDNFPVNDFDPSRLFLGPLTGRTTQLQGAPLAGVLANPMVQAAPSQLALATVADWAWNPCGYDATTSARAALHTVAGDQATALAPLVAVSSSWPPDADQDAELARLIEQALDGSITPHLAQRFGELACADGAGASGPLAQALEPWLAAGAAGGAAGLAAVRLLAAHDQGGRGGPEVDLHALREQVHRALAQAESHYANTARTIISPFVREVLKRTAPPASEVLGDRPWALLLAGQQASAGDSVVADLLSARGLGVRRREAPTPEDVRGAAMVVVASGAGAQAAQAVAGCAAPVLAWARLEDLGMAGSTRQLLVSDSVRIIEPDDALAGGLNGVVVVYRGPGRLVCGEPGAGARVVARSLDGHPVLFDYPAGGVLVDGAAAPALRIAAFLGPEGPAPWLVTGQARILLGAALDVAVAACPQLA